MATFEGSRLLVAGLAGDSGKTLVSLGLTGALRDRGLVVRPFKKGPDYIDAAWLSLAAGLPCRNLDTFLMTAGAIAASLGGAASTSLCLVEGNRGLFDGVTAAGEHSSAELAKRFGLPVVLVVDVTKVTRTAAAMVLGCRALDPALDLAGVVLNRVATARQERLVRTAVETDAGVPVIGAIPRVPGDDPLPCRHLGLVTPGDHRAAAQAVATATGLVRDHVDLDRILAIAATAGPLRMAPDLPPPTATWPTRPSASTTRRTSSAWRLAAPSWSPCRRSSAASCRPTSTDCTSGVVSPRPMLTSWPATRVSAPRSEPGWTRVSRSLPNAAV